LLVRESRKREREKERPLPNPLTVKELCLHAVDVLQTKKKKGESRGMKRIAFLR